jgi:hypothetical protein
MTMMNGDTGSVTTPTKRVDSNPGQTSKGRIRRERKAETSVTQTTSTNKGSIVWTILLAGLVFSLVDIFYIANYLERTSTTTHIIANVPIIAPLKNPSEFLIVEQGTTDKDPESSPEHPAVTVLSVETPKENNDDNDKGPILKLLQEAGINLDDLDPTVMDSLPTWATVMKLYGDKPRIIGLDTCETYRLHTTDPAEHYLGVAGTFNTGTNLMAELLLANCHMPARMAKYGKVNRGIRWQVRLYNCVSFRLQICYLLLLLLLDAYRTVAYSYSRCPSCLSPSHTHTHDSLPIYCTYCLPISLIGSMGQAHARIGRAIPTDAQDGIGT